MEGLVAVGDVEGIRRLWNKRKGEGMEDDIQQGMMDKALRERAIEMTAKGGERLVEGAGTLLNTCITLAVEGLTAKATPINVMTDIFELSCIPVCKELFTLLEDNMDKLKQKCLEGSSISVLRLCNDIVRRLSRSLETSFAGRINLFLSRFMPLNDKSALNIVGHFNTNNVTKYDTQEASSFQSLILKEEGDLESKGKDGIPIDHNIYSKFWQIQQFFSNPLSCYEKMQWKLLQRDMNEVLALLASYKLEKSSSSDSSKKRKMERRNEHYFAKYLTNPKLLHLQLNDSAFRRYFLIQSLIFFQYLTTEVKGRTQTLSDEDKNWVKDKREKCEQLLKEVPSKAHDFTRNIQGILSREVKWNEWKNKACPDLTADSKIEELHLFKKRKRTTYDANVVDMGNAELTRLWKSGGDVLSCCRESSRKFAPDLKELIEMPLLEMDPEQQVEEDCKSLRSSYFQWRASRLLLSKNALLNGATAALVTTDMVSFLENAIIMTGRNLDGLEELVTKAENGRKGKKGTKSEKIGEGNKKVEKDENKLVLRESLYSLIASDLSNKADDVITALSLDKAKAIEMAEAGKDKEEILECLLADWSEANCKDPHKLLSLLSKASLESSVLSEFCVSAS